MTTMNDVRGGGGRPVTLRDAFAYFGGASLLWDAYYSDQLSPDLVDFIDSYTTPISRSIEQNTRILRELRAVMAELRQLRDEIVSNIGQKNP